MQLRDFGRLDWKVSALGFGAMRLPTHDGKPFSGRIRVRESIGMMRRAVDQGVNYIDTAYGYHEGKSEVVVGRALSGRYRGKARIATKCPVWKVKRQKDFDTYLNEQLERLGTERIDFYLFHALNRKTWRGTVLKHSLLKRAEAARGDGRIRYLGFSFHDTLDAFKEIVDGHDGWDLCQIQYNFMDIENQAGTKGLKYAARKGLGVVVMEPLLGGKLANPPAPIRRMIERHGRGRSPADLALQWIWNQPEVSVVLSGMSTIQQVDENLGSADCAGIGSLGTRELRFVDRVRGRYLDKVQINCTRCGYCVPCPHGVNIPVNFELYNDGYVHDDLETSRRAYERFLGEKGRASSCRQCGRCEKKCPQELPISELMSKVHAVLGEGADY